MEKDLLWLFNNFSVEVIVISIACCLLTMLIKWPIKNATKKLKEEKRKKINSIIVLLPLLFATIICTIYYGITTKTWWSVTTAKITLSVWMLSLSVYAIFSKIWVLLKKGEIKINSELGKNIVKTMKQNINQLSKALKVSESDLEKIIKQLEKLTERSLKEGAEEKTQLKQEINQLLISKISAENCINQTKMQITEIKEKLYVKGEN